MEERKISRFARGSNMRHILRQRGEEGLDFRFYDEDNYEDIEEYLKQEADRLTEMLTKEGFRVMTEEELEVCSPTRRRSEHSSRTHYGWFMNGMTIRLKQRDEVSSGVGNYVKYRQGTLILNQDGYCFDSLCELGRLDNSETLDIKFVTRNFRKHMKWWQKKYDSCIVPTDIQSVKSSRKITLRMLNTQKEYWESGRLWNLTSENAY